MRGKGRGRRDEGEVNRNKMTRLRASSFQRASLLNLTLKPKRDGVAQQWVIGCCQRGMSVDQTSINWLFWPVNIQAKRPFNVT